MFTSSFFENKAGFVPDASQPFGKEFDRYAASQNIPKGTPQYDRALVKAASQEVQVTWFTTAGRLRRERILRQRDLERMDDLPFKEEQNPLEAVVEDDESESKEDDDDAESVVSIDVGPSQAFMSDDYRLPFGGVKEEDVQEGNVRSNSLRQKDAPKEPERQSSHRIDSVVGSSSPHKKLQISSPHVKQEPTDFDFNEEFLPARDGDSDNESVVSLDQGLTQKYMPDEEPDADPEADEGDLDDEEAEMPRLTKKNELLGFQALCRETGRKPGRTIVKCQMILKAKPYVNIIDYIDAVRLDVEIPTFEDWNEFMEYTLYTPGKCIPSKLAGKDRFLKWLLQRLLEGNTGKRRRSGNASNSAKPRRGGNASNPERSRDGGNNRNGGRQHVRVLPPIRWVPPGARPPEFPIRHPRSRDARVLPY